MGSTKTEAMRELAALIAAIEAGQVISIAVVTEHHDGRTGSWWATGDDGNLNTLLGATLTLQHRMTSEDD